MFCPNCGNPIGEGELFCGNCGTPVREAPAETAKVKKPVNKRLLVVIAVIAAIVVVGVFAAKSGLIGSFSKGSADNQAVCMKGSSLMLVKDITKEDSKLMEIAKVSKTYSDSTYEEHAFFSKGGKYLYFYDRIPSGESGRLCRIEVSKIKDGAEKNEKQIEEIADNVSFYAIEAIDDENLLYQDSQRNLYYFDGKDSSRLAADVGNFIYDEEKETIIYSSYDPALDENSVFTVKLDGNYEPKQVDQNISELTNFDFGYLVYAKKADDGENVAKDVYLSEAGGEPVKIASGVYTVHDIDTEKQVVYYEKKKTVEKGLYDFVEDSLTDEEANATEPERKDYLIEVQESTVLSQSDREYYAEYPEESFYDDVTDSYYEDDLEAYEWYNYDDSKYYYYRQQDNKWYAIDEEALEAAREKFENIADIVHLREQLQEKSIEYDVFQTYRYADGKEELVVETAKTEPSASGDVLWYRKVDLDSIKVKMEDFLTEWSITQAIESKVNEMIQEQEKGEVFCYRVSGGEEKEFEESYKYLDVHTSVDGTYAVVEGGLDNSDESDNSGSAKLTRYTVAGAELTDPMVLTESGRYNCDIDGIIYYASKVGGDTYDLWRCEGSDTVKLIENVNEGTAYQYEENYYGISVYTDGDGITFSVYDAGGKEERVAGNIEHFTYIAHDKILYFGNDRLYLYQGAKKDPISIVGNVDHYWYYGGKEGTVVSEWY